MSSIISGILEKERGFFMGFCWKCGARLQEGAGVCPSCGRAQMDAGQGTGRHGMDAGLQFDSADIRENKAAAAFSYLGILVLVPLLGAKESKFARFHANQGLALLAASVAYTVVMGIVNAALLSVSWRFYPAFGAMRLAGLVFPALSLMGIMNAVGGQAKELPVVGKIRLLKH